MSVTLSIKDVPDHIADRLRQHAAGNHRSLQGELMAVVEAAARGQPAAPVARDPSAMRTVERIAAERRLRFPRVVDQEPRAVDIIRADRDSR